MSLLNATYRAMTASTASHALQPGKPSPAANPKPLSTSAAEGFVFTPSLHEGPVRYYHLGVRERSWDGSAECKLQNVSVRGLNFQRWTGQFRVEDTSRPEDRPSFHGDRFWGLIAPLTAAKVEDVLASVACRVVQTLDWRTDGRPGRQKCVTRNSPSFRLQPTDLPLAGFVYMLDLGEEPPERDPESKVAPIMASGPGAPLLKDIDAWRREVFGEHAALAMGASQ